jgi:heptosyltransferase-1
VNGAATYVKADWKGKKLYIAKDALQPLSMQLDLRMEQELSAKEMVEKTAKNPLTGDTLSLYPASFVASILPHAIAGIQTPYILFFHSTARQAKRWPDASWIALGQALSKQGYQIVLPWGSPAEKIVSQRLAKQVPESFVPPAFSIEAAFAVIAGAALTIGVDTGLTHLAAVLDKPTVEIYCDSPKWKTEGYWSKQICNVGDMQEPPNVDTVLLAGLSLLITPL